MAFRSNQGMTNSPGGVQAQTIEKFKLVQVSGDGGYWKLLESLKAEIKNKEKFEGIIEQLQRFEDGYADDMRTLKEKLESAGLSRKLKYACMMEAFANKKMHSYVMYPSAQTLFAEICSFINIQFNEVVKGMICEGKDWDEIDSYVTNNIVLKLKAKINNDTFLSYEELLGFVYHLAQKCFIDWDKE